MSSEAMRERVAPSIRLLIGLIMSSLACRQTTITASPSPATASQAIGIVSPTAAPALGSRSELPILIGTEYVLLDNPTRIGQVAELLAPLGLQVAKPLAEPIAWGEMQSTADAPVDFGKLDAFVKQFQDAGFSELVLALKSASSWASKNPSVLISSNPSPKPEYMAAYEGWISSVVERFDADGNADMPGLLRPVRYYEIGSEFSSYEPEPVADYLEMLEHAYAAAHRANEQAIVTHAAFLTTLAFAGNPGPSEYEAAFGAVPDQSHDLADIRQILDRPDLFDVLNVHSLGDPYEIEGIVSWLRFEMAERGYQKGIIISDTGTTPFIAWGPAVVCDKAPGAMGRMIPPAVEADRCRLADYFGRLVAGDETTLHWTQAFAAEDVVKRVVVAAEQGILLINTAFSEDLFWQKQPFFQAGAGTSAWAGQVDVDNREYRASAYALQQLIRHLDGYQAITRLALGDDQVRVYEIARPDQPIWIAWYDPGRLILPEDAVPEVVVHMDIGAHAVTVETLITQFGQTEPNRTSLSTEGGVITLTLTPKPIFISVDGQ